MSESCNSNCGSCAQSCSSRKAPMDLRAQLAKESKVKKVIGIVSGKGGVGKSLTTTMMAVKTRAEFRTAILDADITGSFDSKGLWY